MKGLVACSEGRASFLSQMGRLPVARVSWLEGGHLYWTVIILPLHSNSDLLRSIDCIGEDSHIHLLCQLVAISHVTSSWHSLWPVIYGCIYNCCNQGRCWPKWCWLPPTGAQWFLMGRNTEFFNYSVFCKALIHLIEALFLAGVRFSVIYVSKQVSTNPAYNCVSMPLFARLTGNWVILIWGEPISSLNLFPQYGWYFFCIFCNIRKCCQCCKQLLSVSL